MGEKMVDESRVTVGDLVWFCVWGLSASGKRVTKDPKPRQVRVSGFDPASGYLAISEITDPPGKPFIRVHCRFLYYTEEEAWETYNSEIYAAIDRETKLHEKTMKHLKSKLHDDRKG